MEILFGNRGIYHYLDAKVGNKNTLEAEGKWYQIQMLVENDLPYIFPASFVCRDGEVWLTHNTQNCYALYSLLQKKTMDGKWLKRILKQIALTVRQMEEYLLDAKDLVIQVEYLFYKDEIQELRMVCVPGYQNPVKEQICAFLEYLMPRFNHGDREGEQFLYESYQLVSDEWKDITCFFEYVEKQERVDSGSADACETDETCVEILETEIDTIFSKRFFLFALGGGAALALIIKYLFFDGTTLTAVFGIIWLLALLVLVIMTIREKEEDADIAMREYEGIVWDEREENERNELKANMRRRLEANKPEIKQMETNQRNKPEIKQTETNQRNKPEIKQTETNQRNKPEIKQMETNQWNKPDLNEPRGHAKLVPLTNGVMEPLFIVPSQSFYTIGRDKHADYRITTTQISRFHAKLKNKPDGLYLEDCGSTNGTFVNKTRLASEVDVKLVRGDIVGFANEEFFLG